jgi:hypothetical protein
MSTITLKNGNYAVINSVCYTFNKCVFTFTIYQKNGFWASNFTEYFTTGYYNSVNEYIESNF